MNDPKTVMEAFRKELEVAAAGQPSSLPFIKHTLARTSIASAGELFQVIVAGGSCFQKALVRKTNDELQVSHYEQGSQPAFDTKQALFEFLAEHLDSGVSVLALNFAYPMEPLARGNVLDGVLQRGTKENTFDGLVGQAVGEEFEKYVKEKFNRDITVACANDTICLLLSGLMFHDSAHLAAGIVGTGLNFALFLDQHTAVNLESSNFDKFQLSAVGKAIDAQSSKQGTSLYEKEVAGAYLYQHFNYLAEQRHLQTELLASTKLIDMRAQDSDEAVAETAQEVLRHSAELVAAQIAGIMQFLGRDLTFVMQGSLYWKGYMYNETVGKLVVELCPNYQASFEQVTHSDIYGGAKLVA